jgi:hypothetical protein
MSRHKGNGEPMSESAEQKDPRIIPEMGARVAFVSDNAPSIAGGEKLGSRGDRTRRCHSDEW